MNAMRTDLELVVQPLRALGSGWRDAGFSGAWRGFMQAQRANFPQGLVLAVLLVAVALDGVLAWGGTPR